MFLTGATIILLWRFDTVTILHKFNGMDNLGNGPYGLVQGTDGAFYGTTEEGGGYDRGTIFKVSPTGMLTSLHGFISGQEGDRPYGLIEGRDHNFYGVTEHWDSNGSDSLGGMDSSWNEFGTVFKMTPAGALTTLHTFNNKDGDRPAARLVQGRDGNLYGSTTGDGAKDESTIFRITTSGVLTTLYRFPNSQTIRGLGWSHADLGPQSALTEGSDGTFFGTTKIGGSDGGCGTVFEITSKGVLTTLHSFGFDNNGWYPGAGLIRAHNGDFYGTTETTIFKITPSGVFTRLYTCKLGQDRGTELDGLIQARDGSFYGTSEKGGANQHGTIFKITADGNLTTLYSFGPDDDIGPYTLIQASDGSIYGTSFGERGDGTIFKVTSSNWLTRLMAYRIWE